MDNSFDEMVERIIVREGGSKLTRDPVDPGGTTKYGISQRAHKDVDIENLTHQKAVDIYNKYYADDKECPYRLGKHKITNARSITSINVEDDDSQGAI